MGIGEELDRRLKREAREFLQSRTGGNMPARRLIAAVRLLIGRDDPPDADMPSPSQLKKLRAKLIIALKRERGRARAGSPGYSFNRHVALHQAAKALSQYATAGGLALPDEKKRPARAPEAPASLTRFVG